MNGVIDHAFHGHDHSDRRCRKKADPMSFEPIKDPVLTVALEKPIQFFGETIYKIAFREPTAGDVLRVGNP